MTVEGVPVPADPRDLLTSDAVPASSIPAAVRAQLLATEHWSLLGTRSMTWSEVMARIGIHLTVASAALVVLALVTQASGFGAEFKVLSIGLASAVLILGTLTGIRVRNASMDDAALVAGMNRIRAAYVAMDPTLADHFVTSWHDDTAGVMQTYTMGIARPLVSHIVGSTLVFMNVVNAIVAGTLGALIAGSANAGPVVVSLAGLLAGFGYLGASTEVNRRSFATPQLPPHFPTPSN
ncbi:MAG: hypothetical protein ABI912_08290 [Actinomycetota bacterium]